MTCCPRSYVGADTWSLLSMADLYEKGLPPIDGGSLDQVQSFIAACRFVWNERAYWKRKLNLDLISNG